MQRTTETISEDTAIVKIMDSYECSHEEAKNKVRGIQNNGDFVFRKGWVPITRSRCKAMY